jgi:hypothetical protein
LFFGQNSSNIIHARTIFRPRHERRLLRVKPLTTEKVRLRIIHSSACPALSEIGLFAEPTQ